jgi:hypothetical protein
MSPLQLLAIRAPPIMPTISTELPSYITGFVHGLVLLGVVSQCDAHVEEECFDGFDRVDVPVEYCGKRRVLVRVCLRVMGVA